MERLISMTDFVLEQNQYREQRFSQIVDYALFLKQPLELWMFVPCDEEVNVLENHNLTEYDKEMNFEQEQIYQQAKERVIFEGFIYDGFKYIECKNYCINISNLPKLTIEHLIKHNLTLTETAIKLFK